MTHNHQKNGYSKILGVTFVVVVLAAIISGLYYFEVIQTPLPSFIPTPGHTNKTLIYQDYQFDFQVQYPGRYKLDVSGSQPNYFVANGAVHADISIPSSEFPKTNFSSAAISLAAKNKTTLADCQTYVTSDGKTKKMTKTVALDAGTFYTDQFMGAAAGTAYGTELFRTLHNDVCFEAALTVGITNIQNFDPSAGIKKVNETDVWNDLSAILVSFKFVDQASTDITTVDEGTLRGHVDIGPNCPVQQASNPCPASPDAYETVQIIVSSADRSKIIAKLNVDSSGNYSGTLPGGVYSVTYTTIYNYFQPPVSKVTISAGHTTTKDFSIDTGIR